MPIRVSRCFVLIVVAITSMARADDPSEWQFQQFMPSGYLEWQSRNSGFRPPVGARDLDMIADGLGLDASQREALTDLNRSMIDEFRITWVENQESIVDARFRAEAEAQSMEAGYAAALAMDDVRDALLIHQRELVDTLFADLRLLLTPEQERRWEVVERDRRRTTTLGAYALHDEEALDLVSLVRGLDLTAEERAAVAPILEDYAALLDTVLEQRNRVAASLGEQSAVIYRRQMEMGPVWNEDQEKARQMFEELRAKQTSLIPEALSLRDACDRVRDHNRRFIHELEGTIPESAREEWTKAVTATRQPAMPDYATMSHATGALKMLDNVEAQIASYTSWKGEDRGAFEVVQILRSAEPFSASQRSQIAGIRDNHEAREREIRSAHGTPATPQDASEASVLQLLTPAGTVVVQRVGTETENAWGGRADGRTPSDPEMIKKIRALDLETMKRLRKILTINQRAVVCLWG